MASRSPPEPPGASRGAKTAQRGAKSEKGNDELIKALLHDEAKDAKKEEAEKNKSKKPKKRRSTRAKSN